MVMAPQELIYTLVRQLPLCCARHFVPPFTFILWP